MTESAVATTASSSASSTTATAKKEVDGKELAISLAFTLLELGITLTASYVFSKWIASKIAGHGGGGNGTGAEDGGFLTDATDGGRGVVGRLRNLLEARHDATVRAMMVELEDHLHRHRDEDEKKQDDASSPQSREDDGTEGAPSRKLEETERQYARLRDELEAQHRSSMSTLETLTPYEMSIAQGNVIDPSNLSVTFSDVGGMDDVKSEIYDLVVLPLLRPDLFMSDSGLVSPPKGILLYGPPGTGKTMLAKAIAKESHATFVNVQLSTIMNKWFGESNKLISATFQLARKLAPSVVFIDEMDAFLSQRDGTEGSAVNSMKSEFLTLWDGLLSERKAKKTTAVNTTDAKKGWRIGPRLPDDITVDQFDDGSPPMLPTPPIIVLGATNRPYDVDPAILRRLPRSFEIPLPPLESRLQLLQLFLEKQSMTKSAKDFLPTVAKKTEGYSGSDLKEVCRAAAWEPVREMTTGASRHAVGAGESGGAPRLKRTSSGFPPRGTKARPVNENDFLLAIKKVKKTGESARQFHTKEFLRGREERATTAAEISRAASSNGNKKEANSTNAMNVDMNMLLRQMMAMASTASMNSAESSSDGGSSPLDCDDLDSPPELNLN